MKTQVMTGIKFILQPTPEQKILLQEHCIRYRKIFNYISKEVYNRYLQPDGKLINQVDGLGAEMAVLRLRMILKNDFSLLFDKYEFISQTLRRNITYQVANRYRGYYRRNKKRPSHIISMDQTKAITYNDMMIKYEDSNVIIPIFGGDKKRDMKIKIDCNIPICMQKNIQFLPKRFGGTIDCKHGIFVFIALVKVPWESIYEPQDWLGYDIGRRHFLFFSDAIHDTDIYPHSNKHLDILTKTQELLKKIHLKDIKSSTRSLYRRQWINNQRAHKRLLEPIADFILEYCIKSRLGLSLDGAKFGGRQGSSGQEITDILKHKCIKARVPFFVTSPAYTSQTCPSCKYKNKKNRNKEVFKCLQCGYENHADRVGAINGKEQAKNSNGFVNTV